MPCPSLAITLNINALTSALCGLILFLVPGLIATAIGEVAIWICQWIGVGLMLFALGVFLVARRLPDTMHWVKWIFIADIGWILATPVVMLVFASQLNFWGHSLLAVTALVVTVFAFLEGYWLKKQRMTD